MFSKHVTKDISAYCHGELSSEESRQFAEHIISCVKCRTKYEEIKLGIKLAEQLPMLTAPESLWEDLDKALGRGETETQARVVSLRSTSSWQVQAAVAAAVIVVLGIGFVWFYKRDVRPAQAWQVISLHGTPQIGSESISSRGSMAIGEWLVTDANSRAQIAVGTIGNVDIDENTRVRLLQTQPTEHRLELARGKMSARIWAPPRLFFVDTPSAVAADLGCAYTLEVDDKGAGRLEVTSGWVALQAKERESIVPEGASCETELGTGPGTPYFNDATPEFKKALKTIDFDTDSVKKTDALASMLDQSRPRDTLTLWHLLPRVTEDQRARVYEKMEAYAPAPAGVTREGVLKLDQKMLDQWRQSLEGVWVNGGMKENPKGKGPPKFKLFKGAGDAPSKDAGSQ